MPRKRTIAPRACKKLWEHYTPAQDTSAELFALPASFPADILEDDQLEAVQTWWDTYAADMLNGLRGALICARTRSTSEGAQAPVNLQNYVVHAVVLGHLLRLHPCTEESLPKLAGELGVSCRRLYYARDAILAQLGDRAVAAFKAARQASDAATEALATHPQLNYEAAVKQGHRSLYIPYAGRTTTVQRFAIVQQLATSPGIDTLRDDFMPGTTTHCLFVSLKS